jgi:hypothetical protein
MRGDGARGGHGFSRTRYNSWLDWMYHHGADAGDGTVVSSEFAEAVEIQNSLDQAKQGGFFGTKRRKTTDAYIEQSDGN